MQALDAAPDDADRHAAYLKALNRHDPAEVLRVADAHRPASNPAVVVEVVPEGILSSVPMLLIVAKSESVNRLISAAGRVADKFQA